MLGGERDIYQIVLQLKDEVSASLAGINKQLGGTKVAAAGVQKEVQTVGRSMSTAMAPMRDFSRALNMALSLGGAVFVLNRIAAVVSNMEKAFVKANPEIKKMAGSAYQLTAAMEANSVSMGKVVSTLLSPVRAEFIAFLQQATTKTSELSKNLEYVGDILGQVARYGIKAFQTLFMVVIDGFKLLFNMFKILVDLVKAVAGFIWVPLKAGFLLIIQPIKQAFVDMINFLLTSVQFLVNKIGDAIAWLTGGKLGGGMQGWVPGKMSTEDVKPMSGKDVLNEWQKIWDGFLKSAGDVGNALIDMGKAYVDVWTVTKDAAIYAVKAEDEKKKKIEEILNRLAWRTLGTVLPGPAGQAGIGGAQNIPMGYMSLWANMGKIMKEGFEDLEKWRKDWVKAQEDARIAQYDQAKRFYTNPVDEFNAIANTAGTGAAAKGGTPWEMVGSFFGLLGSGIGELITSLLSMTPLILAVTAVTDIFVAMMDIIGPSIDAIWKPFKDILKLIGNIVGTLLLPVLQPLGPLLEAIGGVLTNILMPIFTILEPLFHDLGEALQVVVDMITAIIKLVTDSGWQGLLGPAGAAPAAPTTANPWSDFLKWLAGSSTGATGKSISVGTPDAIYVIGPKLAGQIVSMGLAEIRV